MDLNNKKCKENTPRKEGKRNSVLIADENRIESLLSLSRLVENDLRSELNYERRVSFPVITSSQTETAPEITFRVWRRNSSVVDFMHELKNKRRHMIQRLLPDLEDTEESNRHPNKESGDVADKHGKIANTDKDNVIRETTPVKSTADIDLCNKQSDKLRKNDLINNNQYKENNVDDFDHTATDVYIGNNVQKSDYIEAESETNTNCSQTKDTLDWEGIINDLRKRFAKFDAKRNVRRSIHADDFQQMLGERYLQLYQNRRVRMKESQSRSLGQSSNGEKMPDKMVSKQHQHYFKNPREGGGRSLSLKIRSLARKQNYSQRTGTKQPIHNSLTVTLPPIKVDVNRETDETNQAIRKLNSKYNNTIVPIHNDLLPQSLDKQCTGVPRHTAKRAHIRLNNSSHISTILKELRRLSSTVDKSDQEEFVDKLEEEL